MTVLAAYRPKGKGNRALTSPLQIGGCVLWLDGADTASVTQSSNAISQWNDKSASGYHVSQSTGAAKPSYANTQNGRKVLTFDGGDSLTRVSVTLNFTGLTMFVVARRDVNAAYHGLWTHNYNGATGRGVFLAGGANGAWQNNDLVCVGRGYGNSDPGNAPQATATTNTLMTDGAWHLFEAALGSGGANDIKIDGATQTLRDTKVGSSVSETGDIVVGASNLGDNLSGRIAEIIVYSGVLTSAQRAAVRKYLRKKWATP